MNYCAGMCRLNIQTVVEQCAQQRNGFRSWHRSPYFRAVNVRDKLAGKLQTNAAQINYELRAAGASDAMAPARFLVTSQRMDATRWRFGRAAWMPNWQRRNVWCSRGGCFISVDKLSQFEPLKVSVTSKSSARYMDTILLETPSVLRVFKWLNIVIFNLVNA